MNSETVVMFRSTEQKISLKDSFHVLFESRIVARNGKMVACITIDTGFKSACWSLEEKSKKCKRAKDGVSLL